MGFILVQAFCACSKRSDAAFTHSFDTGLEAVFKTVFEMASQTTSPTITEHGPRWDSSARQAMHSSSSNVGGLTNQNRGWGGGGYIIL